MFVTMNLLIVTMRELRTEFEAGKEHTFLCT